MLDVRIFVFLIIIIVIIWSFLWLFANNKWFAFIIFIIKCIRLYDNFVMISILSIAVCRSQNKFGNAMQANVCECVLLYHSVWKVINVIIKTSG